MRLVFRRGKCSFQPCGPDGLLKHNETDDEIVEGYRAMGKRRLDVANALLSSTTTLLNQEQVDMTSGEESTNLQGG